MSYKVNLGKINKMAVIGIGGTGSLVSDGICRLLLDKPEFPIYLIDHDRVEPHNLRRQSFYEGDVGKFKSQVIAERLSRQYGRCIAYSVFPFDAEMGCSVNGQLETRLFTNALVIGCVDNAAARRDIAQLYKGGGSRNFWIDAGNGMSSGQVLIGNIMDPYFMNSAFTPFKGEVCRLPAPPLQSPALLIPAPGEAKRQGCAVANDQSPIINQAMAMLVLEYVHRIMEGNLTWLASYIDLSAGTLHSVDAEPSIVARMLSLKKDDLIDYQEKESEKVEVRV